MIFFHFENYVMLLLAFNVIRLKQSTLFQLLYSNLLPLGNKDNSIIVNALI